VEAELIAPNRCVLLVVDVQNDYCDDAGAFGRAGRDMRAIQAAVERILDVVATARRAGVPIIWVRTEHDQWTDSAAWLGRDVRSAGAICPTGTWGAAFYRVAPAPEDRVIIKHRYSAFVGTSLPVVLRALGRPLIAIAGVTTNVCVESTARDAFMQDWQVVLLEDCAAALTKAEHEAAVHNVRTYFGRVADAAAVERAWVDAARR
jgi:ureidoacrylate peracid hydrolase